MEKTSKEIQLRTQVLLCTYDAMLGMISANVRMISIDWSEKSYKILAVYDRPTNENDLDLLKAISTEVAAYFPNMNDIKELAEYSLEPLSKIKGLKKMVYLRYGELDL